MKWNRMRRIANWMAERLGAFTVILAVLSLGLAVFDFFLIPPYSPCGTLDGFDCRRRYEQTLAATAALFFVLVASTVAWGSCAAAYFAHLRRLKLQAIHFAPRLQGWKQWAMERRVNREDYEAAASLIGGLASGSDPALGLTLGGTMLRRLGYALIACGIGFAFIGTYPADYVRAPFLTVAALSPVFFGAGLLLTVAGWTLALEARRSLKDRQARLAELEARAVDAATTTRR